MPRCIPRSVSSGILVLAPTLVLQCGDPPSGLLVIGDWGGAGVHLDVAGAGAALEFDCALGWWPERPSLADGDFEVEGTYSPERPGPIGVDDPPQPSWPAMYSGSVDDDQMRLWIHIPSQDLDVGPYELRRGAGGDLRKCL